MAQQLRALTAALAKDLSLVPSTRHHDHQMQVTPCLLASINSQCK